jgi:nitrate/TMAO reductase-like tetraheme cytochrome c subunit
MINRWLIIELLIFITLFACGGGEEYKETGVPTQPTSQECLECHALEIEDTHYDDSLSSQIEGYALDADNLPSWAQESIGYVLRTETNACYASCHDYHNVDSGVSSQFFESGHSDIDALAFTFDFHSGECLRCHSGIGYASYVDPSNGEYPDWNAPTSDIVPHHLTCNACHDAQGYPTEDDMRLRKDGLMTLVSGSDATFVQDKTLDAGPSATCITCHQARESGLSLYRAMVDKGVNPYDGIDSTLTDLTFVNPHYYPAGAMLFSLKGFEFRNGIFQGITFAQTYSRGVFQHQVISCTGCHMADSEDGDLGGHTFKMAYEGKENISVCQQCHPGITGFDIYGRKEDIEALKNLIITELQERGIFYNPYVYPYFFTTSDPQQQIFPNRVTTWKESELMAAFNLQFVNKEPGAYVHNYVYAVQLLYDSCFALGIESADIPVLRPSRNDRDATVYQ